MFYPGHQVSEKLQEAIITQKLKVIVRGCLITQMKRFDAPIKMQKTQLSARSHFFKNQEKPKKKDVNFLKNCHFG